MENKEQVTNKGEHRDEKSFEANMEALDAVVKNMESGKLSLEDTLKEFQEGIRLSKLLFNKLDDIEGKIEMILKENQQESKIVDFEP